MWDVDHKGKERAARGRGSLAKKERQDPSELVDRKVLICLETLPLTEYASLLHHCGKKALP